MTWRSGVDGGAWDYCGVCRVSTPPNERGECATCGTFIAADRCAQCRGRLQLDPVMGTHYQPCGECYDGDGPTFDEALAGSLALVDAQHDARRLK
jgi:hypothetical protein